jgi:hypothetical protein
MCAGVGVLHAPLLHQRSLTAAQLLPLCWGQLLLVAALLLLAAAALLLAVLPQLPATTEAQGQCAVAAAFRQQLHAQHVPSWPSGLSTAPWTAHRLQEAERSGGLGSSSGSVLLQFFLDAPAWLRGLSAPGLP